LSVTSTKIGRNPARKIAVVVAIKVYEGAMTYEWRGNVDKSN
jgi:hypothetical protein